MEDVIFFEDMFESIRDSKKIVLLMFLIKNDIDLLTECGFLKSDINSLCEEFKRILPDQNEEYLSYFKKEEESILERILDK